MYDYVQFPMWVDIFQWGAIFWLLVGQNKLDSTQERLWARIKHIEPRVMKKVNKKVSKASGKVN